MDCGQKKIREIDLFDFTSFLAWTFYIFWPTVIGSSITPINYFSLSELGTPQWARKYKKSPGQKTREIK